VVPVASVAPVVPVASVAPEINLRAALKMSRACQAETGAMETE